VIYKRTICVINDHGYATFVVITIHPFSIHDLSPGLQHEQHDWCH